MEQNHRQGSRSKGVFTNQVGNDGLTLYVKVRRVETWRFVRLCKKHLVGCSGLENEMCRGGAGLRVIQAGESCALAWLHGCVVVWLHGCVSA